MKLFRTSRGIFVEHKETEYMVSGASWDELMRSSDLHKRLLDGISANAAGAMDPTTLLAPVASQEVWAAGVTYYSSRRARMEESKDAGGGTFYDRVYSAERPELFFKSAGSRVIGPGGTVRIRSDAKWSVPEPELTLAINPEGAIIGYTIGNDMSSRDIEGENPLYLPQAKVYNGSCAIGPCILVTEDPPASDAAIHLVVLRENRAEFEDTTTLAKLKRRPEDLVRFLYRDLSFPDGALLMTGTGIVPHDDFTLKSGDVIRISIDEIGMLENTVA